MALYEFWQSKLINTFICNRHRKEFFSFCYSPFCDIWELIIFPATFFFSFWPSKDNGFNISFQKFFPKVLIILVSFSGFFQTVCIIFWIPRTWHNTQAEETPRSNKAERLYHVSYTNLMKDFGRGTFPVYHFQQCPSYPSITIIF